MSAVSKLTIAIPYHGDRWPYVQRTALNVANDDRVSELVLVDDRSNEADYAKLLNGVQNVQPQVKFPIHVHRNNENLFVFKNKRRAVELSKSDWVCLLDSDNVIDKEYVSAWLSNFRGDNKFAYLPEFAKPEFDYRSFSNLRITRRNVSQHARRKMFGCLMNTMNFVVNREHFLETLRNSADAEPFTADSIWINYQLLLSGSTLFVVPGMQYEHTVHDQSTWRLHHHKGDTEAERLERLMVQMR